MPRDQPSHTSSTVTPGRTHRAALRRCFRSRRRALPAATQRVHAEAVARHFFARGLQLRGHTIGAYLDNAADGELGTGPLLARLLTARKRVALPVVEPGRRLSLHRYRAGTPLTANRFGILEPAPGTPWVAPLSVDVLLVPLVAFDDHGVRLGMGAGFYDRFLGALPPGLRPRLIGLAHEAQRSAEPLPCADWDVPLDGVITEVGWTSFNV